MLDQKTKEKLRIAVRTLLHDYKKLDLYSLVNLLNNKYRLNGGVSGREVSRFIKLNMKEVRSTHEMNRGTLIAIYWMDEE